MEVVLRPVLQLPHEPPATGRARCAARPSMPRRRRHSTPARHSHRTRRPARVWRKAGACLPAPHVFLELSGNRPPAQALTVTSVSSPHTQPVRGGCEIRSRNRLIKDTLVGWHLPHSRGTPGCGRAGFAGRGACTKVSGRRDRSSGARALCSRTLQAASGSPHGVTRTDR